MICVRDLSVIMHRTFTDARFVMIIVLVV